MDDPRAQTLQALEAFIQTQRNLLARQHADIERLHQLKFALVQRPSQILSNLSNELDEPAFRLSEQGDLRVKLPKGIDWAQFENSDAGPLRTFAQKIRDKLTQKSRPSLVQQSDLSELQKFVKHARRSLIDPILVQFENMSEAEPDSDEDPEERRKELEREKIRELKKRKIRGCGLSLPSKKTAGVFIRHDVEDETMEVDISVDERKEDVKIKGGGDEDGSLDWMGVDTMPHSIGLKALPLKSPQEAKRNRRPSNKNHTQSRKAGQTTPQPRKKSPPSPTTTQYTSPTDTTTPTTTTTKAGKVKPKPETYKQAWSVSEQNLLEQLLEEIPDGEKNRWQKISRAMGGKRTPRQVASRVQKYLEKLKRFGVGLD
ncbi:hypothetical protein B0H34DRAFT_810079 [Crassisporium funariophilum]|nr:hypothetical protein B0H34DRAFT_810079 [Crassisporium funariophilum]